MAGLLEDSQLDCVQVPDLIGTRKVFLNKGWAFVPKDLLSSLLVASFRQKLSRSLVMTAGRWATSVAQQESDRLTPIIQSLSSRCAAMHRAGCMHCRKPGDHAACVMQCQDDSQMDRMDTSTGRVSLCDMRFRGDCSGLKCLSIRVPIW